MLRRALTTLTRERSVNAVIRIWVVVVLAILAVACHDSGPTAPSASPSPPTWTISPTSVVMREGDTVAFRITSSGIPFNPPHCLMPLVGPGDLTVVEDLDVGAVGGSVSRTATPTKPADGQCTVTVRSLYRPERVTLQVVEYVIGPPWFYVDVEATIDFVQ